MAEAQELRDWGEGGLQLSVVSGCTTRLVPDLLISCSSFATSFQLISALAVTRCGNEEETLLESAGGEHEVHKNISAVLKSGVGRKRQSISSSDSAMVAVSSGSHWVCG